MLKHYFVYILASKYHGALYVGITNHLSRRAVEHKYEFINGFTKKYHIHLLVYYEIFTDVREAIKREKQLKWWKRAWKIELIESKNPKWKDLYNEII